MRLLQCWRGQSVCQWRVGLSMEGVGLSMSTGCKYAVCRARSIWCRKTREIENGLYASKKRLVWLRQLRLETKNGRSKHKQGVKAVFSRGALNSIVTSAGTSEQIAHFSNCVELVLSLTQSKDSSFPNTNSECQAKHIL
jgi:hypothetical protein